MEFNKEEIRLCEQIAEKHRKEIEPFDWVIGGWKNGTEVIGRIVDRGQGIIKLPEKSPLYPDEIIPLWTISDCLEFLSEKCQDHILLSHDEGDEIEWWLWMDEYKETQQVGSGKSPLEACLKAVIEVLKKEHFL